MIIGHLGLKNGVKRYYARVVLEAERELDWRRDIEEVLLTFSCNLGRNTPCFQDVKNVYYQDEKTLYFILNTCLTHPNMHRQNLWRPFLLFVVIKEFCPILSHVPNFVPFTLL